MARHDVEIGLKEEIKSCEILDACSEGNRRKLAQLATTEGGLLTDDLRKKAWPILLGCHVSEAWPETVSLSLKYRLSVDWKDLPAHKDEHQISLDVNRSFVYYPEKLSDSRLKLQRSALSDMIVGTLRRFPELCYFQGFHDIAQVLLLVLGPQTASQILPYIALLRIRDFMLPSLSPSLDHLKLLPAILYAADSELSLHLHNLQPFFALASTLTLFAHEIHDYRDIVRLFDFLLGNEAVIAIYFFAATIVSRRDNILEIPTEDIDMLHFTLSKLPYPLDLEGLVERTVSLSTKFPTEQLSQDAWRQVSPYSVLKTTRLDETSEIDNIATNGLSRLTDAEFYFAKQTTQLRRQEFWQHTALMMWKYRRAIGVIGTALCVAALSIWLQQFPEIERPSFTEWTKHYSAIFG